jgi:Domain of unknown function (DUF4252)
MRKTMILSILLLVLAAPGAFAQKGAPPPATGLLPLDELGLFPEDKLSVEINIEGALLRMVAETVKGDDPDLSSLLRNLRSIRVQVLPLADGNASLAKSSFSRAVRWLEGQGWKSTVRVREKGEETQIYLKEADGKVMGMTVLAMGEGEAVVINIAGRFDPADIGRIGRGLDIDMDLPGLDKVPSKDSKKKPE